MLLCLRNSQTMALMASSLAASSKERGWDHTLIGNKGRSAEAKKLLEDDRPVIKEWARRAVANLEEMVDADVVRDEEDQLRRR